MIDVKALVQQNKDELIAMRRKLHEHPELSGQEFQTMHAIEDTLDRYGIKHKRVMDAGVFAWIDGNGDGKTILLRADIDGLPITETATNLSQKRLCVSKNPGVMHACGHDAHTAMLLMEAKLLQELKDQWSGTVVFMFEEGEESNENSGPVLKFLMTQKQWKIDTCYATHVRWDIPVSKIAVVHGACMAGGFGFQIKIHGKSGHGARPDLANSPIDCFTSFYHDLQTFRMHAVSPFETATISVGTLHAGELPNIIPDELSFGGSCRFFSYENAGKILHDAFLPMLERSCATYGCTYEVVSLTNPLYEVSNNEYCATLADNAIAKYIGSDVLYPAQPWMASETFALLTRLYPGLLIFAGIANPEKGTGANHHTPQFDLDEDGLALGVAAALGYTLDYLEEKPDIPFEQNIISMEDIMSRNI